MPVKVNVVPEPEGNGICGINRVCIGGASRPVGLHQKTDSLRAKGGGEQRT